MASKQRILIVEDNLDNLHIYTAILEFRGYEVLSAGDGPSGLQKVRDERPDLVLMDVSIPGIDGWTVTRSLKRDPATTGIPIIMLTAHALASDREMAYDTGANGYIPKPADPGSVVDIVARTLREPGFEAGFEGRPPRVKGRVASNDTHLPSGPIAP